MSSKKVLAQGKAPKSKSMGPFVRQVVPSTVGYFDPFVFLDHFGPLQKTSDSLGVPAHPHAGITTITYLFSGTNKHQDSLGNEAMVEAGDLAMMQAGKGIVHAEGMDEGRTTDEVVHGLQLWLSLPQKEKFSNPDFFFYKKDSLPTFDKDGTEIKVLIGELFGHKSPAHTLMPAFLYEFKMQANSKLSIPIKVGDSTGMYNISGEIEIDGNKLSPETNARLDSVNDTIDITATKESHFVILGGTPLDEPIVVYASFVMNSRDEIKQVIEDYNNGKMGIIK